MAANLAALMPEPSKAASTSCLLASGVRTQFGKQSVVKEHADGGVEFAIPCANLTAFRVWLFAMVDHATVIGPPRVRTQVIAWLTEQAGGR